ncbi:MAG: hypothetical protein RIS51_559 [Actinomycetota bacterium]|jgi:O-succinylbenzoic acid--CoA ligase
MQKPIKQVPANDSFGVLSALTLALEDKQVLFVTAPEVNGTRAEVDMSDFDLLPNTAVIVESSGSTGTPKKIQISKDALVYSAEKTLEVLGGPGQWLLALPLTFIAGIQVLTRSIVGDYQPILMNTQLPFTTEAFVRGASLLDGPRRYTSLVPTQLNRLAREVDQDAFLYSTLRKFDAILVGGQRPNWNDIQNLRSKGINIVTTYGMTETSGGCVYDGVPLPGVKVSIEGGRIRIAGPVLAEGLGESYLSSDLGELVNGKLEVIGRADRVLISGGLKVSLDRVEEVLEQLNGIIEAAAVGLSNEEWGERVAIAYQGSPEVEIEKHLVEALGHGAKPVRVVRLSELPKLSSGKLDRVAINQTLKNTI